LTRKRASRHRLATLGVKTVLIIGASCLAGAAQFLTAPAGQPLPFWNAVGIIAVLLACLGGLYTAFVDQDASHELEVARQAIEAARTFEEDLSEALEDLDRNDSSLTRLSHLYSAVQDMRSVIESSVSLDLSEQDAIRLLMTVADRSLKVAAGFQMAQHWTLCVYRTDRNPEQRRILRCVASSRSVDCDLDGSRVWPEGVGAAGITLARGTEVIVPDLTDPGLGNIHELPGPQRRDHDDLRYRSIAAVPIMVGTDVDPWGVVVATSDQCGHFKPHGDEGTQAAEAVRALAGMVELTISVRRRAGSARGGGADAATADVVPLPSGRASTE